jgi:hypothetical protein
MRPFYSGFFRTQSRPQGYQAQRESANLQIASEHGMQRAVIASPRRPANRFPQLRLLYATLSAGKRSFAMAKYLQTDGMRQGAHDLCLPIATNGFHGLHIEMKRRDSTPSDIKPMQRDWIRGLHRGRLRGRPGNRKAFRASDAPVGERQRFRRTERIRNRKHAQLR